MSVPLLLLLLAPLAGAVAALTFAAVPAQRRILVGIASAAMLGGSGAALVRAASAKPVSWRGFSADAWTALLAAGAVAVIVAGIARAGGRPRAGTIEAALFAAGAGGVAPILVHDVHLVAATLPLATLSLACAVVVSGRDHTGGVAARRTLAALALSDVAAIAAIGTAVSSGTHFPADLSVPAGAVLLTAIAIRVGLVPFGTPPGVSTDPVLRAIWLGPVRAQAFFLLPTALAAGRSLAYTAAAAAALGAIAGSVRMAREGGFGSASLVGASVAVIGLGLGGAPATWGAVLCLAATFAAVPAWFPSGATRSSIRPTLAVLPAGGMLAGAVLVTTSAFDAAASRPAFIGLALPALGGVLVLGASVLSGGSAHPLSPRERGDRPAAALWGVLAVAAALCLAAVPGRIVHGVAFPAADVLGVGRLLRAGPEPGVPGDTAVVMVAVAALGFLAGPGRMGSGGPARSARATWPPWPALGDRLPFGAAAWTGAAAVLFAGSVGVAIRVYVVAAGRGFL